MTSRRYEQGGVASFIVIATVLALLLAGGLWIAKSQTTTTPSQTSQRGKVSQETAVPPSNSTDNTKPSTDTTKPSASSTQPSAGASTSSGQTSSTSTTNGQTSTQDSVSSTPSTGPTVAATGPSAEELPSTGPAEILTTVISIVVVTGGVYTFLQSQKRLRLSALK